jgi:hypothetical protein
MARPSICGTNNPACTFSFTTRFGFTCVVVSVEPTIQHAVWFHVRGARGPFKKESIWKFRISWYLVQLIIPWLVLTEFLGSRSSSCRTASARAGHRPYERYISAFLRQSIIKSHRHWDWDLSRFQSPSTSGSRYNHSRFLDSR